MFDDVYGNVSFKDLDQDTLQKIEKLSVSFLRLRTLYAFIQDNCAVLTTQSQQLAALINKPFEDAYEELGKLTVQSILISALIDNYSAIEEQFLEFLKKQFFAQIKALPVNERAQIDEKYKI